MRSEPFNFFVYFAGMKAISILSLKIILVCTMLVKPLLVSCYLFNDSKPGIIVELTENEEDKSEKKSLEADDEIYHSTNMEWNSDGKSNVLLISFCAAANAEDQIREILSPPPQG